MRHQAASDFEAIKFVQIIVRADGGELEDLIEAGVRAGRFRIVENKAHPFSGQFQVADDISAASKSPWPTSLPS
ncbi:hypothetical protein [Sphingobium sp. AS12]|uniref:hypothetical protein n=1 Tax=Sphingobium sp. AS12 TaxID=2849495 RepID=UPI0034A32F46